jgi:hypothetical protein
VKRVWFGFGAAALAGALAGCAISDPTENEFAPKIVNDTQARATVAYCNGASSCTEHWWNEMLRPGQTTSDSVNAGGGSLSVFAVSERGQRRCIRLTNYTTSLRLSAATRAACHAPYG